MTEYIKFYTGDSKTQEKYSPDVSFGDICIHIKQKKMYQVYQPHGGAIEVCDGWEEEFENNTSSKKFQRKNLLFAIKAELPPKFLNGMKRIISPVYYHSYSNDIGTDLMHFFRKKCEEIPSMHEQTGGLYRIESFTYKLRSDEEIFLMKKHIREMEERQRIQQEIEDARIAYLKALKRGISKIRDKWMHDHRSNYEIMTMIMDQKISFPGDISSDEE